MSGPRVAGGRAALPAGPISIIAQAEARRTNGIAPLGVAGAFEDPGPDLVTPTRPLAPRGLAGVLDDALGAVRLPTLLQLADALDLAAARMSEATEVDPALAQIGRAVIADEHRKIMRYLDLRSK